MRFTPLIILIATLISGVATVFAQEGEKATKPLATESVQAAQAKQLLATWQQEEPVPSKRALRILYWSPADREPAPGYQERLTAILEHVQAFYRSEMERHGFGPLVFPLDRSDNGQLKIHLAKGHHIASKYGPKSGDIIRRECLPAIKTAGLNPSNETFLIFCNLANWNEKTKDFSHRAPLLGIGSHRGGVAWLLDSPHFAIENLTKTRPLVADKRHGKVTIGKHHSIYLGAIAHELGHALSLPHSRESPLQRQQEQRSIMGEGRQAYGRKNRSDKPNPHLTFANALRLASHPLFSNSQKALTTQPHAHYRQRTVTAQKNSFTFSGRIAANIPVYAVIAYLDPDGNGDYDAHTITTTPDADGYFSLDCEHLVAGKSAELRLLSCHVNGATCQRSYPYAVSEKGRPEIATLRTRFALAPLITALNARDHSRLQAGFDHIHTTFGPGPELEQTHQIAKRLVAGVTNKPQTPPLQVPAVTHKIPLSDLTPAEAKVGWGKPAYDHLPSSGLLLLSQDRVHPHGIFAHAPAYHHYQLGAQWKKLTGTCGLAENRSGSVVFIIKTDGREVYRSPVIRSGQSDRFQINLTGVKKLELITNDAGDDKVSDWALWLSPTLHR